MSLHGITSSHSLDFMGSGSETLHTSASTAVNRKNVGVLERNPRREDSLPQAAEVDLLGNAGDSNGDVETSVCDSLRKSGNFGVSNLSSTSESTVYIRGAFEVSAFPSQQASNSNDYNHLHDNNNNSNDNNNSKTTGQAATDNHILPQHIDAHTLNQCTSDQQSSSLRRKPAPSSHPGDSPRSPSRRIENTTADSGYQARLGDLELGGQDWDSFSLARNRISQRRDSIDTLSAPNQGNSLQSQLHSHSIDTTSATYMPRSAMGYISAEHTSNPWSNQEASVKLEINSRYTEAKEHESDGHSAASTASATTASPSFNPLPMDRMVDPDFTSGGGRVLMTAFGTPSTVSTVASTDDTSVDGLIDPPHFERLSLKIDDSSTSMITPQSQAQAAAYHMSSEQGRHRRSMSWEDGPGTYLNNISHTLGHNRTQRSPGIPSSLTSTQQTRHSDAWNGGPSQARVATFRGDHQHMGQTGQYGYPQVPHTDAWRQQQRYAETQQQYYPSQQMTHLPPSGQYRHTRKVSNGAPMTPPRSRQNRTPQQRQPCQSINATTSALARSSSEVLKTLLRKKACLYEPDTSKAVALVTWLVGRELALENGYFSRQQLQSGVHVCVAKKIDSGTITRTKVNRCMQIILNSCFHYIIPRPDGSEENGDAFRVRFAETTQDDRELLASLSMPWNNVSVDREAVLQASIVDEDENKRPSSPSPQHSPILASSDTPGTGQGDMDNHSKRAVLLCFNENVRSAKDVFHCHNEFIRDTANAAKLQLTASEWHSFFGKDSGCPSTVTKNSFKSPHDQSDFLGMMTESELGMFRTSWCSKRYDHDHDLCGFAHVEISRGWLRRDPTVHLYRAEMCPDIVSIRDQKTGVTNFVINQCENGVGCQKCHSVEELSYHPSTYKTQICSGSSLAQGCALGDLCPRLHPHESQHAVKKQSNEYRTSHPRHTSTRNQHELANSSGGAHVRGTSGLSLRGAPMLYVSPAPFSSFEKHLQMPGLQNLFRRHSSVIRAHLGTTIQRCTYSNFGDDNGISGEGRDFPTQAVLKQLPKVART